MSASPPDIAIDAMKHAIGNDSAIIDGLRRLKAPVVAINPDHRPTDIEALRRHGVKTMIMSGVGHFGMLEDPDNFNCLLGETIEEFKESQQRRTLPRT
jgi:pimeloyl-ACP methyl ester carboxylesterase